MVQGVGFRYFTTSTAKEYEINGYIRNLDTGDVELEVEGHKNEVMKFLMAIKQGPRWSSIQNFQIEWKKFENNHDKFFVKYK